MVTGQVPQIQVIKSAGFDHNREFDAEKRPEDLDQDDCEDIEDRIRNLIKMKKDDDGKKEFEEKHTEN